MGQGDEATEVRRLLLPTVQVNVAEQQVVANVWK